MAEPKGAYGLHAVGQLFTKETQAIFFNCEPRRDHGIIDVQAQR